MRKIFTLCAAALLSLSSFGIGASQEWVRHFTTENFAPFDIMDSVQSWVIDYVKATSASTNTIDDLLGLLNSKTDDEIKVDDEGRLYYNVLERSGTTYTNKVYYLTPGALDVTEGDYYAARIVESSNDMYKVGDVYALARKLGDGNLYLVNGGREFSFDENVEADNISIRDSAWLMQYSGEIKSRITLIQSDSAGNETKYVTFEPLKVFLSSWEAAIGLDRLSAYDFENIRGAVKWTYATAPAELSYTIVCNLSRVRMMMRSAGLTEQPTAITIPVRAVPLGRIVDTIDYAAANGYTVYFNGEHVTPTHENCWASPEVIMPPEDWFNVENWVELPITVTTYYQADDGLWYETEKKIRKVDALKNLLAVYPETKIPPRGWPNFELTAKEDCRITENHIYGKNCVCIVCGHQRKHWFDDAANNRCGRCINTYDTYTRDRYGQYIKTGESSTKCGATPLQADDGLDDTLYELHIHGGWYHEAVEGNDDYNCSCECGFYSKAKHELAHNFDFDETEIPPDAWRKEDKYGNVDGIHHFAVFTCKRCDEAKTEVKERHNIIADESVPAEYYDDGHHQMQGYCSVCDYGKNDDEEAGYILEAHEKNADCYCAKCDSYVHNFYTIECGRFVNEICADCGQSFSVNADGDYEQMRHDYGLPLDYEDDPDYHTYHQCYCGAGPYEEHIWIGETCKVCDVKKEKDKRRGIHCASKKAKKDDEHSDNRDRTGGFLDHAFNTDIGAPESAANRPNSCPDCTFEGLASGFFEDFPNAVDCWDKPAEYHIRGGTASQPIEFNGYELNIPRALSMLASNFNVITDSHLMEGAIINAELQFNPEVVLEVKVRNFAFAGNGGVVAVRGDFYQEKAVYRGVVENTEEFGLVIKWN